MTKFTAEERVRVIQSVIGSQALSGVKISHEIAERAFDEVMREPVIDLGSDDYWTPEEHEAWDAAIARGIAQNPPQPLRRAIRMAKRGRPPL